MNSWGIILTFAWISHVLGQRPNPISVSMLAFNSIGSLLKQWLRELPSEIFPKDAQARIKQADPLGEKRPLVSSTHEFKSSFGTHPKRKGGLTTSLNRQSKGFLPPNPSTFTH